MLQKDRVLNLPSLLLVKTHSGKMGRNLRTFVSSHVLDEIFGIKSLK